MSPTHSGPPARLPRYKSDDTCAEDRADVAPPIPGGTLPIAAQTFQVPEQNIRVMDKTIYTGTLSAMYALHTGGLAGARIEQARPVSMRRATSGDRQQPRSSST